MPKKLEQYKQKRDFEKTPEPKPQVKKSKSNNIFVIQQHHASHMHYDLRLEIDGVLKSWAIPKGPSTNPTQKRLAVLTEDHPLDYATFEGIIPIGYGAGTVIVWDTGTYENQTEKNGEAISIANAFVHGHIKFTLHGKKLQGAYTLTRFMSAQNWLLTKANDEFATAHDDLLQTKTMSALSRKTIKSLDKKFEKMNHNKKS